jgi:Arc/MetJ family transcription regulator
MRTTLDIDAELLDEAMRLTGAPTKTAAVHLGLKALVDEAARRRLAALHGSIPEATAPPRRRAPVQDSTR